MTPKIVAVFCHRYEEPWMVDELRENLAWADEIVGWDTSADPRVWVPRQERVAHLMQAAREAGADWVYYADVDERLEDGADKHFRNIANVWEPGLPFAFKMRLRELYAADQYRVDGIWAKKTRRRFFHLESRFADMKKPSVLIERPWIYHLKHIEAGNAERRAALHNAHNHWDKGGRPGGGGFDYLADTRGARFAPVPANRPYSPPYTRPYVLDVPGY